MIRGINYKEGTNTDYKSIEMHFYQDGKNKTRLFDTGNFVKDWYDATKWFINESNEDFISDSSSVNHFIMDGAPYDSAYLLFDKDNKPFLFYDKKNYRGLEFFVEKGTKPTWKELKQTYDN